MDSKELEMLKNEVIDFFQNYRTNNNMTQKEFAELLETNQQAISRLERGSINPSLNFLVKTLYRLGYKLEVVKND